MLDSFDTGVLIKKMRENNEGEELFIEKSNGKRIRVKPNDRVEDMCGYISVTNNSRQIVINPIHIISIITRGDL